MEHNIPDGIFQKLYDFLVTISGIHTKDKEKMRLFLEGVYFMCRSGCQVRLLPKEYGNCFCVYQRFLRWKYLGIWEKLFEHFHDIDGEYFMIDGSVVRANQCAAGYKKGSKENLGRSRGGFSTKIHVLVDALGNPVKFLLSPGNEHDISKAEELTRDLKNTTVLADKGYDSQNFVDFLERQNCVATIPSRSNCKKKREIDRHLYGERHLVENLFNKIKCFRRVFSRFCKTSSSFLSFLHFVGAIIWLR
jgi:transposase